MIFVLIRPSFHLIESQSSRTHNLYYYNVAVLNLNSPPLPSFHHNTSEVIVAIDLLCKTTIWCSSGVARNDPTAALCWIRLFLRAPNQSVVWTSWKLAKFSRELRSLHTCNLGAVWVLFFPWAELWFDVHMEPALSVDSNASCCWTISTWPWDTGEEVYSLRITCGQFTCLRHKNLLEIMLAERDRISVLERDAKSKLLGCILFWPRQLFFIFFQKKPGNADLNRMSRLRRARG
jgi:hypothetical protein